MDLKNTVKNFLGLVLNRGLDTLFFILAAPVLVKSYGSEGYGFIAYFISLSFLGILLVRYGFENAILRHPEAGLDEMMGRVFVARCILFLVSCICLFIFGTYIELGLAWFPITLLVFSETFNVAHVYVLKNRVYLLNVMSVMKMMSLCVFLIFFVTRVEWFDYLIFYAIVIFFVNIILYVFALKQRWVIFFIPRMVGRILWDGIYLFLTRLIFFIYDRALLLLLPIFVSYGSVAYFDVGMKIVGLLIVPVQLICVVLIPVLSNSVALPKNIISSLLMVIVIILSSSAYLLGDVMGSGISEFFFSSDEAGEWIKMFLVASVFMSGSIVIGEVFFIPQYLDRVYLWSGIISILVSFLVFIFLYEASFNFFVIMYLFHKIIDFFVKLIILHFIKVPA